MSLATTYTKGLLQYWLNMVTIVSRATLDLCRSVEVISMRIFFVANVILEWFPVEKKH